LNKVILLIFIRVTFNYYHLKKKLALVNLFKSSRHYFNLSS